jgi:hypothetical protein
VTSRSRELVAALLNAQAGGFLATPPGFERETGLGIAGIHGDPRPRMWDAVASASAPGLPGDAVGFVVLEDGTVIVEDDVPDGALIPLADALERTLAPPYRAAAIRHGGDVWAAVAEKTAMVELRLDEADVVDLTFVEGERELTVDGERTIRPLPALDLLAEQHRDVVLHAERVDGNVWTVDVFLL